MSVDSLMDNGASLESLKPTNILFSWEKTSSLDEVLSICKLQKHFGAQRCRYSNSNLSPSLLFKWYSKFTILVDLYGPLKLVLIFAASTASTLLCIKNTLKIKKNWMVWNLVSGQLSFYKTKSMPYTYKLFIYKLLSDHISYWILYKVRIEYVKEWILLFILFTSRRYISVTSLLLQSPV